MGAVHDQRTVMEFLIQLAKEKAQELERKGILPKGKT